MWVKTETIGNYEINEKGEVRNCKNKKIIKPFRNKCGYIYVSLNANGKQKNYRLHRLIAKAFIPNPNNYPYINHIDMNKTNNDISNLEWCTNSQNMKHAYAIKPMLFTEEHKKAVMKNAQKAWLKTSKKISHYVNGEKVKTYKSINSASKDIGRSRKYISKRIGYEWRYE